MSVTLVPSLIPLSVTEHPAVSRARLHRNVSLLVERLIGILDDLDGPGVDLEDSADDEPSLSAAIPTLAWEGSQDGWLQGVDIDTEDQCEDEGANPGDMEPDYHDADAPETGEGPQ